MTRPALHQPISPQAKSVIAAFLEVLRSYPASAQVFLTELAYQGLLSVAQEATDAELWASLPLEPDSGLIGQSSEDDGVGPSIFRVVNACNDPDAQCLAFISAAAMAVAPDQAMLGRLCRVLAPRLEGALDPRLSFSATSPLSEALDHFVWDRRKPVEACAVPAAARTETAYSFYLAFLETMFPKAELPTWTDRLALQTLSAASHDDPALFEDLAHRTTSGAAFYADDITPAMRDRLVTHFITDAPMLETLFKSVAPSSRIQAGSIFDDLRQIGSGDYAPIARHIENPPIDREVHAFFAAAAKELCQRETVNNDLHDVLTHAPDMMDMSRTIAIIDRVSEGVDLQKLTERGATMLVNPSDQSVFPPHARTVSVTADYWYSDEGKQTLGLMESAAQDYAIQIAGSALSASEWSEIIAVDFADQFLIEAALGTKLLQLISTREYLDVVIHSKRPEVIAFFRQLILTSPFSSNVSIHLWDCDTTRAPEALPPARRVLRLAARAALDMREADRQTTKTLDWIRQTKNYAIFAGGITKKQNRDAIIELVRASHARNLNSLVLLFSAESGADYETFIADLGDLTKFTHVHNVTAQVAAIRRMVLAHPTAQSPQAQSVEPAIDTLAQRFVRSELDRHIYLRKHFDKIAQATRQNGQARCAVSMIGRAAIGMHLTAAFQSHTTPFCDAYLFTIANSARQTPSKAPYLSVIDTVQADYVAKHWKRSRESIFAAGYINLPSAEALENRGENAAEQQAAPHRILVATQAGFDVGNQQMIANLGAALARGISAKVLLRLHPREPKEAFQTYLRILSDAGFNKGDVLKSEGPLLEAVLGAQTVITQTSNVGIEAAAAGRMVIRDLSASEFLSVEILDVPYASNVFDQATADAAIYAGLTDPAIRAATSAGTEQYLQDNPHLLSGGGAFGVIDWLLAHQR